MTNVDNYRKIYFPSEVDHPKTHRKVTDGSKVNEKYLSTKELQSKFEMAHKKKAESIIKLNLSLRKNETRNNRKKQ